MALVLDHATVLAQTQVTFWIIGGLLCLFLVIVVALLGFIRLWVQAFLAGVPLPLMQLIGMRLRKVDSKVIVRALIAAKQAGLPLTQRQLESHALAGGDVMYVVTALSAARGSGVELDFERAALSDLLRTLTLARGVAESDLCPAGAARLAGRRVEVVTRGERIAAGTPITVLAVEGNRVVVAASAAASPTS